MKYILIELVHKDYPKVLILYGPVRLLFKPTDQSILISTPLFNGSVEVLVVKSITFHFKNSISITTTMATMDNFCRRRRGYMAPHVTTKGTMETR